MYERMKCKCLAGVCELNQGRAFTADLMKLCGELMIKQNPAR